MLTTGNVCPRSCVSRISEDPGEQTAQGVIAGDRGNKSSIVVTWWGMSAAHKLGVGPIAKVEQMNVVRDKLLRIAANHTNKLE